MQLISKLIKCRGPFHERFFPSQFEFNANLFCLRSNFNKECATKFCTRHDSYIMSCSKICSNRAAWNRIKAKRICHGIKMENRYWNGLLVLYVYKAWNCYQWLSVHMIQCWLQQWIMDILFAKLLSLSMVLNTFSLSRRHHSKWLTRSDEISHHLESCPFHGDTHSISFQANMHVPAITRLEY